MYSKFTIENYRSFQAMQVLKFAIPDGVHNGSGITYIVGENNSGKTTLIEGMKITEKMRISDFDKRKSGVPKFAWYDNGNEVDPVRTTTLISAHSSQLVTTPQSQAADKFDIIPSRRQWSEVAGHSNGLEPQFYYSQTRSSTTNIRQTSTDSNLASLLLKIERDTTQKKEFVLQLRRVVPNFTDYAVGYDTSDYIKYVTGDGTEHRINFTGDGMLSIMRIIAHCAISETGTVSLPLIIDEPELSLHPLAQKRLMKVLAEHSRNRQIIISTHSPYFISWGLVENGAVINKVVKEQDRESKIYTLKDYSHYSTLVSAANWQQPYLMDVVAKEIFFHDNFLFTEGQEDVGLLMSDGQLDESINLFGYGVRGKDMFKFALRLAKDLGIRKAAVVLDGGESEAKIKEELEREFVGYSVVQWNKEDIRDKAKISSSQKNGYFTIHGVKKNSEEIEDFDEKIGILNRYFRIDEDLAV
ncbi:MAG TPA: AAA family ATPase [Candidatus Paceibacterota bacterium]|nr:AAA family ATPase [Candidatus Paceibacterota bacterium]